MHGRRPEADFRSVVLAKFGDEVAVGHGHTVELLEEIDVEIGAAKFAVRDALEAHVLLGFHHLANAFVFDLAESLSRQLLGEEGFARFGQPARPQETADMVGAERRLLGHASPPNALAIGGASRRRASLACLMSRAAGFWQPASSFRAANE